MSSVSMVLYALGWRLEWGSWQITEPGIFYFKAWPKPAQIYINGRLEKKTDFFFGSAMLENLPAGVYSVEIRKDGYYSWKKSLEIKPREATEIKNIVLVPTDPGFTPVSTGVEKFFMADSGKKMLIQEEEKENGAGRWSLKLFEPNKEKGVKSLLAGESDLLKTVNGMNPKSPKNRADIKEVDFSSEERRVLVSAEVYNVNAAGKSDKTKTSAYFVLDIFKNPASLTFVPTTGTAPAWIGFNPANSERLIAFASAGGGAYDAREFAVDAPGNVEPKIRKILAFSVSDTAGYFLDDSGYLYKVNFSLTDGVRLNAEPFPVKKTGSYTIYSSKDQVLLKENDSLYLYLPKGRNFDKIYDSLAAVQFSNDSKKACYFNHNEMKVIYLAKKNDQPVKTENDKVFITRFSENIGKVYWYTGDYLIFNVGDKIKVAETDDRDKINIVDLASFKNPDIFWNDFDKRLYVLTEGRLLVSAKLTP